MRIVYIWTYNSISVNKLFKLFTFSVYQGVHVGMVIKEFVRREGVRLNGYVGTKLVMWGLS